MTDKFKHIHGSILFKGRFRLTDFYTEIVKKEDFKRDTYNITIVGWNKI